MVQIKIYDCASCKAPMISKNALSRFTWLKAKYVAHRARGLCNYCYQRASIDGSLIDVERLTWPAEELLAEWVLLRDDGHNLFQAAERLSIDPRALDRALARAKLRGDPRGNRQPFGRLSAPHQSRFSLR